MRQKLERNADKAIVRALNKTIRPVATAGIRVMAKEMRVPQKAIRKHSHIRKATFQQKRATITMSGRRIPIMTFGARQTKRGVTYKGRSGGRQLIPGAFIATMPSGHVGVFKRTGQFNRTRSGRYAGQRREAIGERFGPSPPHVFVRPSVQKAMESTAAARWKKNLDHELNRVMKNG